jgi:hypothetical protein
MLQIKEEGFHVILKTIEEIGNTLTFLFICTLIHFFIYIFISIVYLFFFISFLFYLRPNPPPLVAAFPAFGLRSATTAGFGTTILVLPAVCTGAVTAVTLGGIATVLEIDVGLIETVFENDFFNETSFLTTAATFVEVEEGGGGGGTDDFTGITRTGTEADFSPIAFFAGTGTGGGAMTTAAFVATGTLVRAVFAVLSLKGCGLVTLP